MTSEEINEEKEVKITIIKPDAAEPNIIENIRNYNNSVGNAVEPQPVDTDRNDDNYHGKDARRPPPTYEESLKHPTLTGNRRGNTEIQISDGYDHGRYDQCNTYSSSVIIYVYFETKEERNRFVQRVYSILTIQLAFNFLIILIASLVDEIREFVIKNSIVLLVVFMITFFITLIGLFCCPPLRRSYPCNVILLAVLTISLTVLSTLLSCYYKTQIVLFAMGTTALVCLVISVFAIQTNIDITKCTVFLCVISLILFLYGMIVMILYLCNIRMKILHTVYAAIAVFVFSMYLMYDTQQIIGGRRYSINTDEYYYGAVLLYIDIMYIFIHIMHLFGACYNN